MDLLTFMSGSPVLSFFLALLLLSAIVRIWGYMWKSLGGGYKKKCKCKCNCNRNFTVEDK